MRLVTKNNIRRRKCAYTLRGYCWVLQTVEEQGSLHFNKYFEVIDFMIRRGLL